jgi:NAD(P)H-dependent FMN reductase
VSTHNPRQKPGVSVSARSTPSWRRLQNTITLLQAVLKNAFDSAFLEWQRKPIAFVGYGVVGAARAVETLRGVVVELQMTPIRQEVNIGLEPYLGIVRDGRSLDDYEYLVQGRAALFNHLVWWGQALMAVRE